MLHHQTMRSSPLQTILTGIVIVVLGGGLVYGYMKISSLTKDVKSLSTELASTTAALSSNTNQLSKNINDLSDKTIGISNRLSDTKQNIDAVKSQVGGVEETVGSISGTVGTLQKLSQVDPELLKKYSKVYFMNENYVPAHLTIVPNEYLYSSKRQEQFLSESWPHLQSLLEGAKTAGVTLYIKSGYRSFAEQKSLKTSYSVTYGAGTANAFSADQGYSEHQLGTTLDFITSGLGGQLTGFEKTTAYTWLTANAYQYGFVLSYPKGNKYYVYEPWHWRYVGVKLATYLHTNNLNFYDMDQRDIDTYLVNIFD
ncbi:MAG: D-alanyl-D-alanine carboxypeptidase family protein [Candidatus Pacebacteria bacterium]|nr:D-alanyl-D-alanine carboxypeptidase family protein [Candidatus Paceibacterota bacterium]